MRSGGKDVPGRGVSMAPGRRHGRGERGVSLIEVLVAILVLSFGLLGIAMLQLKGSQFTKDSASRSSAFIQARSIADAMRANPVAARGPAAASSTPSCPYCTSAGIPTVAAACPATASSSGDVELTAANIAKCDLARWGARLAATMPAPSTSSIAQGSIEWNGSIGAYEITTSWTGTKLGATDPGDASYELTYVP